MSDSPFANYDEARRHFAEQITDVFGLEPWQRELLRRPTPNLENVGRRLRATSIDFDVACVKFRVAWWAVQGLPTS